MGIVAKLGSVVVMSLLCAAAGCSGGENAPEEVTGDSGGQEELGRQQEVGGEELAVGELGSRELLTEEIAAEVETEESWVDSREPGCDEVCGTNEHCRLETRQCVCDDGFEDLGEGCVAVEPPPPTATFEELGLAAGQYWNGSDGSGQFTSGPATLLNNYNSEWGSWDGWSYSAVSDGLTSGLENQYAAYPGLGADSSLVYAVAHDGSGYGALPPTVQVAAAGETATVAGMWVANTTWAYWSMKLGDDFAKRFGGADGAEPDWFLLTVTGYDGEEVATGTVEFYLADFRANDDAEDYILEGWEWLPLDSLGPVVEIRCSLSSSDTGDWGMNTPGYFAMDNLTLAQ